MASEQELKAAQEGKLQEWLDNDLAWAKAKTSAQKKRWLCDHISDGPAGPYRVLMAKTLLALVEQDAAQITCVKCKKDKPLKDIWDADFASTHGWGTCKDCREQLEQDALMDVVVG